MAGPCRNRTGFAGDPRIQLCARDGLGGGDESFWGESRGVGEVRGVEALQGHDVRAEAVDLEVIAFADPLISGEADRMGPVVAAECRFESLELDPIRPLRACLNMACWARRDSA